MKIKTTTPAPRAHILAAAEALKESFRVSDIPKRRAALRQLKTALAPFTKS